MTTLNKELYEALIAAGVPKQKAQDAATASQEIATRKDVYFAMGFIMAITGAGFGYIISILNIIIASN